MRFFYCDSHIENAYAIYFCKLNVPMIFLSLFFPPYTLLLFLCNGNLKNTIVFPVHYAYGISFCRWFKVTKMCSHWNCSNDTVIVAHQCRINGKRFKAAIKVRMVNWYVRQCAIFHMFALKVIQMVAISFTFMWLRMCHSANRLLLFFVSQIFHLPEPLFVSCRSDFISRGSTPCALASYFSLNLHRYLLILCRL